jgi:hypothetical protein
MCAIDNASMRELTRPKYSSMIFGLLPAASMRVGVVMWVGIARFLPLADSRSGGSAIVVALQRER